MRCNLAKHALYFDPKQLFEPFTQTVETSNDKSYLKRANVAQKTEGMNQQLQIKVHAATKALEEI